MLRRRIRWGVLPAALLFALIIALLCPHQRRGRDAGGWLPVLHAAGVLAFEQVIIDAAAPLDPHIKLAGDLNGDGFPDLVAASSSPGEPLVWYEYPAWMPHTISTSGGWSTDGELGDVDGDGDLDIVISRRHTYYRIEWHENPGPLGDPAVDPWPLHAVGGPWAHDVEVGDVDGDGDLDIAGRRKLSSGGDTIQVWRQNTPQSWSLHTLACPAGEGLALADLDGDGDLDAVIGGRWYENDGIIIGGSWMEHLFSSAWLFPECRVETADVDGDGRRDVILSPSEGTYRVSWFAGPADPTAGGWAEHVLEEPAEYVHGLAAADVDLDGDIDLVTAEMHQSGDPDEVAILCNDGAGSSWTRVVLATSGSHNIGVADIGNDGDVDIFGANWSSAAPNGAPMELWRNDGNPVLSLDLWQRHVVDAARPWRAVFVGHGDVDGDGREDIATGAWWYRNPGSASGGWVRSAFGSPLNNLALIEDLDGDGDLDILGTEGSGSSASASFVWAENDGGGTFAIHGNIEAGDGDFLQGAVAGAFGAGGGLEVALSWHQGGVGVQRLTVPAEPAASTWVWSLLSASSQDEDLDGKDIDGDGDADLLLGTRWLRNDGGSFQELILNPTAAAPDRNELADINGDGRLDAVVGFEAISVPGTLAWYEQPPGAAGTWSEHVISSAIVGPMSLDVADMDGDGDLDVVAGEHFLADPASARLLVFENTDGAGLEWLEHLVFTGDEHHDGARVFDIDGDGDRDVISIGWGHDRVLLYENLAIAGGPAPQVEAPAIDPIGGVYPGPVSVALETATAAAEIRYTLDGGDPDQSSPLYAGPISVAGSSLLKARAYLSAVPSPLASAEYIIAPSSGSRVSAGLQALYSFDEGSGSAVLDLSGVNPPLDLTIESPAAVRWMNGGLKVQSSTIISSGGPATKIIEACAASDAITLEAWIRPASTAQEGPARIVSISADPYLRDLTLGQDLTGAPPAPIYDVRLRTTASSDNGFPSTATAGGAVTGSLSHVVYTRASTGEIRIYVDLVEQGSGALGGTLDNWDGGFALELANEATGDRPWLGDFFLVAIYDRDLAPSEIAQNFGAGPFGGGPPVGGGSEFLRGDANDNGALALMDAVRILEMLFAAAPLSCMDAADVDDDGVVGTADPIYLLMYLFLPGNPPPPAPFPGCGVDPTPGALDCSGSTACP